MMKPSQANGFFGILISRPTGVLVILTTLIVLGVMSYMRLPLQMLPGGIEGSRFTVMVANPGSSAAENVEKVARPIEEQLSTLPNLDDVWTVCRPGSVRISIRFNSAGDLQLAKAELRDRIERARPKLPTDVGKIWVWSNDDGDMPIIWMAVTASECKAFVEKSSCSNVDNFARRALCAENGSASNGASEADVSTKQLIRPCSFL